MNYSEAMQVLARCREDAEKAEKLQDEMEQLWLEATSARTSSWQKVAGGSGAPRADPFSYNLSRMEDLRRQLERIRQRQNRIEAVASLLPPEDRRILNAFYIHPVKNPCGVLQRDLGGRAVRTVYRRRRTAVERFGHVLEESRQLPRP